VEEADEIGMRELSNLVPNGKLLACGWIIGRNKFDGGLAGIGIGELRQEDGAVIGGSEEMMKRELIVGELAFPLFPNIAHGAPSVSGHAKQQNSEAFVQGWKPLNEPQTPGGWAVYATILARNGEE
jgi:hypothetical protein